MEVLMFMCDLFFHGANYLLHTYMTVQRTRIPHIIKEQKNQVTVVFQPPCQSFPGQVDITMLPQWTQKALGETYQVDEQNESLVFKVKSEIEEPKVCHRQLLEVVELLLGKFEVAKVSYSTVKYGHLIEAIASDLQSITPDIVLSHSITPSSPTQHTLSIVVLRSEWDHVEEKLSSLEAYQSETVIYPMDRYFSRAKQLTSADQVDFVKLLVKHYGSKIKERLSHKLRRYGMEGWVTVDKIEPYENVRGDWNGFKGQSGIVFYLYAYQEALPTMYRIIDRWIDKITYAIAEIPYLDCCSDNKLHEYCHQKFKRNVCELPTLHQGSRRDRRILIFEPEHSKSYFEDIFMTSDHLLSPKSFNVQNFSVIKEFQSNFLGSLVQNNLPHQSKLKVFSQFMLFKGMRHDFEKVKRKIEQFLEDYEFEQCEVNYFNNRFLISLFEEIYLPQIKLQPIVFYSLEDKLYRKNRKRDSERADEQLHQVHRRLLKELGFRPLRTDKLPVDKEYFRVTRSEQWLSAECIKSRQYSVEKKFNINVRSYGSLGCKEGDCIFLVNDRSACSELTEIIKQEGLSQSLIEKATSDKSIKNSMIEIKIRQARFFSTVMPWTVREPARRVRGDSRWTDTLKESVEHVLSLSQGSKHIKFMVPEDGEDIVRMVLPEIIQNCLLSCRYLQESKVKDLTFFTSLNNGPGLRHALSSTLMSIRQQKVSIEQVSDLVLRLTDVEKIVEFEYYQLKYFEDEATRSASPLNSFLFNHESSKKKRLVPIFLPTPQQSQAYPVQCLVNTKNGQIFNIRGRVVSKSQRSLEDCDKMSKLCAIIKKVFTNTTYILLFANSEFADFCTRLFFKSAQQSSEQYLQKLQIDMETSKIIKSSTKVKYQLTACELLETYKIETHKKKLAELNSILSQ